MRKKKREEICCYDNKYSKGPRRRDEEKEKERKKLKILKQDRKKENIPAQVFICARLHCSPSEKAKFTQI